MQQRMLRRRQQIRAVLDWTKDLLKGREGRRIEDYCRLRNVSTLGIRKVLKDERVQRMIDEAVVKGARYGVKVGTERILERLLDDPDLTMKELVSASEHLEKLKHEAYRRREEAPLVEINLKLPDVHGYEEARRIEAREVASKRLGGMVER